MGLIVDSQVEKALLAADAVTQRRFVAGCVERLAQLFTGLRGADLGRQDDVVAYVDILNDLWHPDLSRADSVDQVRMVEGFSEMHPEEEVSGPTEIAAAIAVLVLRHATRFAVSNDLDDALMCAHVAMTLAGLTDQNVPDVSWSLQEVEFQLRDASGAGDADELRSHYQRVSRERLDVVLRREA